MMFRKTILGVVIVCLCVAAGAVIFFYPSFAFSSDVAENKCTSFSKKENGLGEPDGFSGGNVKCRAEIGTHGTLSKREIKNRNSISNQNDYENFRKMLRGGNSLSEKDEVSEFDDRVLSEDDFQMLRPNEIQIGDERFKKADIISDFLDVAFSSSFWVQGVMEKEAYRRRFIQMVNHYKSYTSASTLKNHFGNTPPSLEEGAPFLWLKYFTYRDDSSFPKEDVINKWQGDLSISIGWPLYEEQDGDGKVKLFDRNSSSTAIDDWRGLIVQIKSYIPELEKITKKRAFFIAPGSQQDRTKQFARIRIIPVREKDIKGMPFERNDRINYTLSPVDDIEPFFLGMVTYPSSSGLLDYFIPDAKNIIELSVCRVPVDVDSSRLHYLVGRCLLRALGLPGVSSLSQSTFLNEKAAPKHALGINGMNEDISGFSAYDLLMAEILYCKDISPGMGKYQVITTLVNSKTCLQ